MPGFLPRRVVLSHDKVLRQGKQQKKGSLKITKQSHASPLESIYVFPEGVQFDLFWGHFFTRFRPAFWPFRTLFRTAGAVAVELLPTTRHLCSGLLVAARRRLLGTVFMHISLALLSRRVAKVPGRAAAAGSRTSARAILTPHRFRRGARCGPAELSPRLSASQRAALAHWLGELPAEFTVRLPRIKIAVAAGLQTPERKPAHAASFIPQRYLLLAQSLLSRPGELGRILYHELCHFLWPRLGTGRRLYEAVITRETEAGIAGELGYSAAAAKEALCAARGKGKGSAAAGLVRSPDRSWRHYLCESFCDTGAWLLLRQAGHRRRRHSEWTLEPQARPERLRAWRAAAGLP